VADIKVIGNAHLVVDGYCSMEIIADFTVFSPQPGMILQGIVNKVSSSLLGCLIMDMFNASLELPRHKSLNPTVGCECTFQVTEVLIDGEILFVRGVAQSCSTAPTQENMQSLQFDRDLNNENKVQESHEKDKTVLIEPSLIAPKKRKSKKHRKSSEDNSEDNLSDTKHTPKKHKSKKKKKSSSEDKDGDISNIQNSLDEPREETQPEISSSPSKHKQKKKRKSELQFSPSSAGDTKMEIKDEEFVSQDSLLSSSGSEKKKKRKR